MSAFALANSHFDRGLSSYLEEVKKFPLLSKEEEFLLCKQLEEEKSVAAAHKLVTSHLRLVVSIAMKFRSYGLPLMDLISEGNIGLMKAVKKFTLKKGARLSTYAMWWVKASIQEYIIKSWSMLKIGSSVLQKKLFSNVNSLKKKITDSESSNEPSENYNVYSLNNVISGDSDDEFVDLLAEDVKTQEEVMENKQDKDMKLVKLRDAIARLRPRDRAILLERRMSENPVTLKELSETYNISSERVRQIEESAIKKIKNIAYL